MADPLTLAPGPEMDAALGERMGVEPKWGIRDTKDGWVSSTLWSTIEDAEESRQSWAYPDRCEIVPIYPALSTTDEGMGTVLDWLEQQGYTGLSFIKRAVLLEHHTAANRYWFVATKPGKSRPESVSGEGTCRPSAVGRAALLTREARDGDG